MIDVMETVMLTAFSIGWYVSILKMLKTGQAAGKSKTFALLAVFGYCCGTRAKAMQLSGTGTGAAILAVYVWNSLVVAFDALLVLRLSRRGRRKPAAIIPAHETRAMVPAGRRGRFDSIGTAIRSALNWLVERDRRYRERAKLREADAALLKDVGLTRQQIEGLYRRRRPRKSLRGVRN